MTEFEQMAVEKQKAKKPIIVDDEFGTRFVCSCCRRFIGFYSERRFDCEEKLYCNKCGQKIDWSEREE